jgi:hypothetical protein
MLLIHKALMIARLISVFVKTYVIGHWQTNNFAIGAGKSASTYLGLGAIPTRKFDLG